MVVRSLSFLFLLSFGLALAAPALASSFYAGWVYPGDTFTAKSVLYAVAPGSSEFQLLLQKGGDQYLIDFGECVSSIDGLEEYCFNESDYVDCARGDYDCEENEEEPDDWCCPYDVAHVRYDAGKVVFGYYLALFDIFPEVTVQRSPETTSLKLGDTAKIAITLKNGGTDAVTSLTYTEVVPDGFIILYKDQGWQQSGNNLTLKVTLNPSAEKSFSYKVKPRDYVSGLFRGNLTYTFRGVVKSLAPTTFTINVPSPFLVSHGVAPTSVVAGEEAAYVYSLKNNDGQYDMTVVLQFEGLDGIAVEPLPDDIEKEGSLYVYEGKLAKGKSLEFEFPLRPRFSGSYQLNANATMTLNGETFTSRVGDTLASKVTPITPMVKTKAKATAGSELIVRLLLNNSGETTFRTVESTVSTSPPVFVPISYSLGSISPGSVPMVAELNLTMPMNVSSIKISFMGSYGTSAGEKFNFSTSADVAVTQLAALPYLITQKLNVTKAFPGDSVTVVVKVKNQQESYATVSVTDILPAAAIVGTGTRQKEISLNKDEEREAYTYTVTIPESYDESVFDVTTQVFDKQSGDQFSVTANITVDITLRNATAENATVQNATQQNTTATDVTGGEAQPEKQGFFRRMFDGLGAIIDRIFS